MISNIVTEAKLLGAYFTFAMGNHVNYISKICAQRSYLLKLLGKQGLSTLQLNTVFHALIMSIIVYAVPSFHNHLSGLQIEKIDSFLKRMNLYRCGFTINLFVFRDIANDTDDSLFDEIIRPMHCLNHLLPPVKPHWGLRLRKHQFILPLCKSNLIRNSFIPRCLFKLV